VDLLGNTTLVWQGFDGSNYVIQSSSLPVLGSWTTPVTLSASGEDAQNPTVQVDILGNAVSIWSRYDGTNSIIQASQLRIGGSWSSSVNISTSGGNADSSVLSMDRHGTVKNAVAVWHRFNGSNFIIQGATLPYGGSWSSPANISASGEDAIIPTVAVDSSGNSVITCSRFDGADFSVKSATQLYSQTWGPNFTLSVNGDTVNQPTVGVDFSGNAVFAWSEYNGTNYVIKASNLPFGGTWTTPVSISDASQSAYIPQICIDSSGNSVIIWVRYDGSNYILQGATADSSGNWSTPVNISAAGSDVGIIDLSMDINGNAMAALDITDSNGNSKVQAAKLPKGGSWETPSDISTPGLYAYYPDCELDSLGNAYAIWLESSDGSTFGISSATRSFLD
jgi:hypothetical protein